MLDFWIPLLAVSTTLAATGFVVVAVLWLKKLRTTVQNTMREIAGQQVCNAQRLSEAVGQLRKQQRSLEQQLQDLTQSSSRLRQDVAAIATRVEISEREHAIGPSDRILH
ncbi:MAG: hypothetical protein PHY92_04030 [Alphaproteobacteria bacterium]|nr:hypothetical protein [Alphaproteobacteria bacterium]